jgi:proteasome accessory factor B
VLKATRRIERLLKLIQALESGRSKTVDDLAAFAGVSRRTVFRDLKLLSGAGLRYAYERETRRYSADRETLLPPVTLSHAEALVLMLAMRHLVGHQSLVDESVAASASLKLESMLPAAIRDYCRPLLRRMEIRGGPVSDTASIREAIALLQTALADQMKVRISYDSYSERSAIEAVLHPYRIAHIHRGWYLIAYTEGVSRVQTYKIERILRLRVLDASFMMDRTFSLDDYFGNAWLMVRGDKAYHVKVRFFAKVAANVDEITWHRTQRTCYEEDGSLLFEVDVDGVDEISWWILGYGDQAQVLEPPELRKLIARRVKRMHAYYRGQDPPSADGGA